MRFLQDPYHRRRVLKEACGFSLLGLLALPLLAGCGGGGGGSNGNPGSGATTGTAAGGSNTLGTNTGMQQPTSVSAPTATGLTATLTEASTTVSVGGTLVYTLTLTNNTPAAILVRSNGTNMPSALLTVRNASGTPSFQPVPSGPPLASASLAPGQSISLTQTANGFTAAGTYSATAAFGDDTSGQVANVGPLAVTAQ